MDAIWVKVKIITKETWTGTFAIGTGTLETGKKRLLEAPLRGLKKKCNFSKFVNIGG